MNIKSYGRNIFLSRAFLWSTGIVLALFILYTVAGFFLVPYVAKRELVQYASGTLGRTLAIERIRFNPYSWRMEFAGLSLKEADGEALFSLDRLDARLKRSSLFRRGWTFSDFSLSKPFLSLVVHPKGESNLSKLARDFDKGTKDSKTETKKKPADIRFNHIRLEEGRISYADLTGTTPARIALESIGLDLKDAGIRMERPASYTLRASLGQGGTLESRGSLSLSPIKTQGRFTLKGLKASVAWPFFRDKLNMKEPQGVLDAGFGFLVDFVKEEPRIAINDTAANIRGLSLTLKDEEEPALALNQVEIGGGVFKSDTGEVSLGRFAAKSGSALIRVDENGMMNWTRMFPNNPETSFPGAQENKALPAPLHVSIREFQLGDVGVRYLDAGRGAPFEGSLKNLHLKLSSEVNGSEGGIQISANGITMDASDVLLKKTGQGGGDEVLLQVPGFSLSDGRFDSTGRHMSLGKIALSGGSAVVRRDASGTLNWTDLLTKKNGSAGTQENEGESTPKWEIGVAALLLERFGIDVIDMSLPSAVKANLQNLRLKVADFTNAAGAAPAFELSFDVAQGGSISAKGTLDPAGPGARGTVELKSLSLVPYQPYLASALPLVLDSGEASLQGELQYGAGEGPGLTFAGGATLEGFRLRESRAKRPIFAWDSVVAKGLKLNSAGRDLVIEDLILQRPSTRILIRRNRTVNLQDIFSPPGKKDQGPSKEQILEGKSGSTLNIKIKRTQIRKGELDFADMSLPLPFAAQIDKLGGAVTGLSSSSDVRSAMSMEGRVGRYGSVNVDGELQPFNATGYSDVKMAFHNIEMTTLTPYLVKFAGRKIESGKLSLDLHYKIEQGRLSGDSNIIMDSVVLGEEVESPGAKDLPLDLALALLKDSEDRIQLGLPISGDLRDPQFSLAEIYWKAIRSAFTKIIAAPFYFLASLVGRSGEQLDKIEFDPAKSVLGPPEAEKVASVAKALKSRPQLSLHVQGRYDPKLDESEMKRNALRREIARRTGENIGEGENPGPINFTDPDVQEAIEAMTFEAGGAGKKESQRKERPTEKTAKKSAKGEKQPDASAAQDAAVQKQAELYRKTFDALAEAQPIDKNALEELAKQRAQSIVADLTGPGGIEPGRIKILPPATVNAGKGPCVPSSLELKAKEGE